MKTYLNIDWIFFWRSRFDDKEIVDEKYLREYILQYKDTSVTDLIFNVNGTTSSTPTAFLDSWTDKYLKTTENGEFVDYKNTLAALHYDVHERQKLDAHQIWVQTAQEIGVRAWLSVRMNDVHGNWDKVHLWKAEEIEQHPNWWIVTHRKAEHYFDRCLNYAVPAVRERILGYIFEQLNRYDVDGLELDFTREPYCFPVGFEKGREIMLEFMREVKTRVDEIALSRGKEIKIAILVQANPSNAYESGFDVAQMATEGLVDVVVASPRWETNNTDIPIELWKRLLPENVEFGCMQQYLTKYRPQTKDIASSLDMAFGMAVANASRGTDLIYLYNYFDRLTVDLLHMQHATSYRNAENIKQCVQEIGRVENALVWDRRVALTYDDFPCLYQPKLHILPLKVAGMSVLKFQTGKITNEQNAYFIMQTAEEACPQDLEIYANGVRASYTMEEKQDSNFMQGKAFAFAFTLDTATTVHIEILPKNPITVTAAEIFIEGLKK